MADFRLLIRVEAAEVDELTFALRLDFVAFGLNSPSLKRFRRAFSRRLVLALAFIGKMREIEL